VLAIFWSKQAQNDVRQIVRYIAKDSPTAARGMRERLQQAVLPAAEYPLRYRESERVPGTREIQAHPSYRIFYRIIEHRIEVVRVAHVRRRFPFSD